MAPRQSPLDTSYRTLVVIWLAMVAGVASFGVVTWVLLDVLDVPMSTLPPGILTTAAPFLVLLMAAGLYVGQRMEAGIPRGLEPEETLRRYQTARIVSLAVSEAGGLAFIVLSLLAGEAAWALGGAAICVAIMTLGRPRREDLDRRTRG